MIENEKQIYTALYACINNAVRSSFFSVYAKSADDGFSKAEIKTIKLVMEYTC